MYYENEAEKESDRTQIEYRNLQHVEDKKLQQHMPNPDQPDLSFVRDFFFFLKEIISNRGSLNYHFLKIQVLKNYSRCAVVFSKWHFSKRKSVCITLLRLSKSTSPKRSVQEMLHTNS